MLIMQQTEKTTNTEWGPVNKEMNEREPIFL